MARAGVREFVDSAAAAIVPASGPGRSRTARRRRLETAASPAMVARAKAGQLCSRSRRARRCHRPAPRNSRTDRRRETNSGPAPGRAVHCRRNTTCGRRARRQERRSEVDVRIPRLDQAAGERYRKSQRSRLQSRVIQSRVDRSRLSGCRRPGLSRRLRGSRWHCSARVKKPQSSASSCWYCLPSVKAVTALAISIAQVKGVRSASSGWAACGAVSRTTRTDRRRPVQSGRDGVQLAVFGKQAIVGVLDRAGPVGRALRRRGPALPDRAASPGAARDAWAACDVARRSAPAAGPGRIRARWCGPS